VVDYIGGCLCGALRYQAHNEPIDRGYCHCRLCQRSAGAPVLAWATFSVKAFLYTQGTPMIYRSSAQYQREFCGRCGTQIAFRKTGQATTVDVTLPSLEAPSRLKPEYHIWTESQIPWFDTLDELPRYKDNGPDV
jgi:hypothetical protein